MRDPLLTWVGQLGLSEGSATHLGGGPALRARPVHKDLLEMLQLGAQPLVLPHDGPVPAFRHGALGPQLTVLACRVQVLELELPHSSSSSSETK